MHLRRVLAAPAAALAVTSMLVSCGFDYGTDQRYTPGAGIIEQTDAVDILSAVIVSGREGEGTFIATLSNRDQAETLTFDSVQGAEQNAVVPADIEPLQIAPGEFANLATDERGVKLQGTFAPGAVIPLSIGFTTADGSDLEVVTRAVVVRACDEYAGLDPIAPEASQSATPSVAPTDGPETVSPTEDSAEVTTSPSEAAEGPDESGQAEETAAADADPYSCALVDDEDEPVDGE